jgi:hypothetical protein
MANVEQNAATLEVVAKTLPVTAKRYSNRVLAAFGGVDFTDLDPNNADPMSADPREQRIAGAAKGLVWEGIDGVEWVCQGDGIYTLKGAAERAYADAAKLEAIATSAAAAELLINAAKIGRLYKGEIDIVVESYTEMMQYSQDNALEVGFTVLNLASVPGSEPAGAYIFNDELTQAQIDDGINVFERMANAAHDMPASGALWYVRITKELFAVESDDGHLFGDSITIGRASAPIEISGGIATDVINGQVNVRVDDLEWGGTAPLSGENIKVAYSGPLLGVNDGRLFDILAKIEKNQRRELVPLAFTVTQVQLEDLPPASGAIVSTSLIPEGFMHDTSKLAKARIFGGGQLKGTEFLTQVLGQSVSITLSVGLTTDLREYPQDYDGEVLLPIIPS